MAHPFKDKLIVFIGNPARCSRQAARDALTGVGGVPDERITTFTHYAVAFSGAEKTKAYKKAVQYDGYGSLVLLNENQFFGILEGKSEPPAKKETAPAEGVTVFPACNPEAGAQERERAAQYILAKKRAENLAKHGTPTPDGGRIKIDFGSVEAAFRYTAAMKNKSALEARNALLDMSNCCDICGKPVKVLVGDGEGGELFKLCLDCHNQMMAEFTGIEIPDNVPKRLSFENSDGKKCDFEIEFEIFDHCKTLTATEIGETTRKADVYGELDEDFNAMLETLIRRIEKSLSITYVRPDGYFNGGKAVGYIEYNRERGACDVIIDGKPYTWAELEKNLSSHEGWKIKIEFGDVGDELD